MTTVLDTDQQDLLDSFLAGDQLPCGVKECGTIADFYAVGIAECYPRPISKLLCAAHKYQAQRGYANCGRGCHKHPIKLTYTGRTR